MGNFVILVLIRLSRLIVRLKGVLMVMEEGVFFLIVKVLLVKKLMELNSLKIKGILRVFLKFNVIGIFISKDFSFIELF